MGAEVRRPQYNGVDVDHPTVQRYAKNMAREGKSAEEIARVIGIPREIAREYREEVKREK